MTTHEYLASLSRRYALGNSTEHTFRGDLQSLIETLADGVAATNEPKRIECGAPDYVITLREIPIGYIEAKDIGVDLAAAGLKEQFDRYRNALDNLIFTDYLDFRFYLDGEPTTRVRIAEIRNGKVVPLPENFEQFASLINAFCTRNPQTIKSSKKLAEMMADKAKMLAYIIRRALESDESSQANSTLREQMAAFKQILIHDIDAKSFADIYAQTIAYGMFAARLHDPTLETFSRQEAAENIPKTNPFLRKLFQYIAGYDLDDRIKWVVDALAEIFRASDVGAILKNFGKSTQTHDPIMHFYETFLAEYDPRLRKSRGVFYTPEPVVDFIVRAVDDILKTEFGLPMGLADTSKTKVTVDQQGKKVEKEFHKVQILDPATGTGTFLAQVIKQIHKSFAGQQGIWNNYVENHLIPRLNGFELLMASYAMAHLKLDLLLTELGVSSPHVSKGSSRPPDNATSEEKSANTGDGYPPDRQHRALTNVRATDTAGAPQRFQIYLTNSLEEYHPDTGTLWASWLSTEANEANHIKRDTPVMVVIGNPPYSGISSNMGKWISDLIEDYKYVDGEHFGERKHWLHDDYVKFIRFGQQIVEKTGDGILAFINNHSFLDNPTFKGMRWNLLKSFNSIYVLDLQGSSKKTELVPEGVDSDENVFDIQQGVSINIFVRSRRMKGLGKVKYSTLWGSRKEKYQELVRSDLGSIQWQEIQLTPPNYFFTPQDYEVEVSYQEGFEISKLFGTFTMGFASAQDKLTVDFEADHLWKTVGNFKNLDEAQLRMKYALLSDSRDWTVPTAKMDITENFGKEFIKAVSYRPFDERFTYYTGNSRGFYASPQKKVMSHLGRPDNIAFCSCRMNRDLSHTYWLAKNIVSKSVISSLDNNYVFPLYLYPDDNAQQTLGGKAQRTPNLNPEIVKQIAEKIGLEFQAEPPASAGGGDVAALSTQPDGELSAAIPPPAYAGGSAFYPIDILDYIYAVLHSPSYREKYKEFLKIDFPRVPYPKDADTFWRLVKLGGELRQIHLLESPRVEQFITGYPEGGTNEVVKPVWMPETRDESRETLEAVEDRRLNGGRVGRVYINSAQYFSGVPEAAWNFFIGGYQPAQKWLKDRKGRTLDFEDIRHYQKIIVALTVTDRIMKEIGLIELD